MQTTTDTLFQSTRPGRGATHCPAVRLVPIAGFNPRAPDGARRTARLSVSCRSPVSIHAPRTGRDRPRSAITSRSNSVSIHAPRTGRDIMIFK